MHKEDWLSRFAVLTASAEHKSASFSPVIDIMYGSGLFMQCTLDWKKRIWGQFATPKHFQQTKVGISWVIYQWHIIRLQFLSADKTLRAKHVLYHFSLGNFFEITFTSVFFKSFCTRGFRISWQWTFWPIAHILCKVTLGWTNFQK